jgi:cobaltochelatase CobS
MDRWHIVAALNFLEREAEIDIVARRVPAFDDPAGRKIIGRMVAMAELSRQGFVNGEISTVMSPRTVITWAENASIFGDLALAFRVSFLNRCDEAERALLAEYYQRSFDVELPGLFQRSVQGI